MINKKEIMLVIEKDKYLNCWVVWEIHRNYKVARFHANSETKCKTFIKKLRKEAKNEIIL